MPDAFDAILLVSFGGPEGPDDVWPFLERVAAGRGIPPERLAEVADRYHKVGGVSPLNRRIRELVGNLADELARRGVDLPIYWGNRNATPLLADTLAGMADAGHRRALAWSASPYSSYSSCRQYGEDLEAARETTGVTAPRVKWIRRHHDHPGLIKPAADRLSEALDRLPTNRRQDAVLAFSAHSIPTTMATGCRYEAEVAEVARLVAERADLPSWNIAVILSNTSLVSSSDREKSLHFFFKIYINSPIISLEKTSLAERRAAGWRHRGAAVSAR